MKLGKSNKPIAVNMACSVSVDGFGKVKSIIPSKPVDEGVFFKLVTAEEKAKYRCEAYSYIL